MLSVAGSCKGAKLPDQVSGIRVAEVTGEFGIGRIRMYTQHEAV